MLQPMSRHTMRSRFWWLLALAFAVCAVVSPATAFASTSVAGTLSVDTTWTAAGSPYMLTDDVRVAYGTRLSIQPGVEVQGGGRQLVVFGSLVASGTSGQPILMRNLHLKGRGTYVLPSTYETFTISIEHADVDGGSLQGGQASMYGSWVLLDSLVTNSTDQLYLWFPRAESRIERTIFLNGGKVSCGVHVADVLVRNSIFWRANAVGETRDYVLENWASFGGYGMIAEQNSFMNPGMATAALPDWGSSGSLNAANNWWSVTDTPTIEAMIFDRNDNLGSPGFVTYLPFLGAASPQTPHDLLPLGSSATVAVSEATVSVGATTTVTGTTLDERGAVEFGQPVRIQESTNGVSGWVDVAVGSSDASGTFSHIATVSAKRYYRVVADGVAGIYDPAVSATTSVDIAGPKRVDRVGGANRYEVAANMAATAYPGWVGLDDVIIACGEDRANADPLAAAGLSGVYDAPILLTETWRLNPTTKNTLTRIAAVNPGLRIRIVGGPGSVPPAVVSAMVAIPGVNSSVDRIGGADRYEVTANIANRMVGVLGSSNIPGVLIVCGSNPSAFYDALAAGPIAANKHLPMLAVRPTSIPATVQNVLDGALLGKPRYVVSSTAYVSNSVYNSVGAVDRFTTSADRYTASRDIANKAVDTYGWLTPRETAIAAKLPDALTGGAFIGKKGSALLFTDSTTVMKSVPKSWITSKKAGILRGWVLGGPASVTEQVKNEYLTLIQ